MSDGQRLNRYVDAFAACVVRSHRHAAVEMLMLPYLSTEQRRAAGEISDPGCLGRGDEVSLRIPSPSLIGRVARFMIHERFDQTDPTRFAGLSDEAAAQIGLVPRNNAEDLALCAIRRDPAAVRRLIQSEWDSGAEAEAMQAVLPNLGPCTAVGERLELNVAAVRLLLATGLYRALVITTVPGVGLPR